MTVLWHAVAGGVGLIACQWLKAIGANVIGTVGSDEKASLAKSHGCDHTINYTREDFVARVKEITGGAGVPVVYDSVGRLTFADSLAEGCRASASRSGATQDERRDHLDRMRGGRYTAASKRSRRVHRVHTREHGRQESRGIEFSTGELSSAVLRRRSTFIVLGSIARRHSRCVPLTGSA